MAYWWVSQNQTYKFEREGGYLWAPKVDKAGNTPHHWLSILDVQPGDIIFSFVDQSIKAIGVAQTAAIATARPGEFSDMAQWQQNGFRIDLTYEDVTPPLAVPPIASKLIELLPDRYSPLNRNGTGNQGYFFVVADRAARFLLSQMASAVPIDITPSSDDFLAMCAIQRSELDQTEKEALVKSRIGQGRFRKDLMRYWGGRCAVTGISISELLRASHIKPWCSSNNRERLDHYNGLLLTPHFDAAFDAGIISFANDGALIASPHVDAEELCRAGIDVSAKLQSLDEAHTPYLIYHRDNVLKI